jgi:RNA polymerase sigma-70 factor (ECF subfamily)
MSDAQPAPQAPAGAVNDDETALVEALRAGDAKAFETMVRLYAGRMLAVARRLVGNDEEARDVVQDALLSAFRAIGRFEGQSRVSTWLHRITVNTALMKLRTRRRKPEESIEPLLPSFQDDGHHAIRFSEWEGADQVLERAEVRQAVRQAIEELPDAYRTVLMLRDIEELSTEETAEALQITPNTVKTRLHRARQALRTVLDERMGRTRA